MADGWEPTPSSIEFPTRERVRLRNYEKNFMKTWTHPGGKLVELGPSALSDEELLAVLIGSGYKGRTAQDIAKELLDNYYSIAGLMGKNLQTLLRLKGLKM